MKNSLALGSFLVNVYLSKPKKIKIAKPCTTKKNEHGNH